MTNYVRQWAEEAQKSTAAEFLHTLEVANEMYATVGPLLETFAAAGHSCRGNARFCDLIGRRGDYRIRQVDRSGHPTNIHKTKLRQPGGESKRFLADLPQRPGLPDTVGFLCESAQNQHG